MSPTPSVPSRRPGIRDLPMPPMMSNCFAENSDSEADSSSDGSTDSDVSMDSSQKVGKNAAKQHSNATLDKERKLLQPNRKLQTETSEKRTQRRYYAHVICDGDNIVMF